MLKTIFVGLLDSIKSGGDQSFIADFFGLYQMVLIDFQTPAGVLLFKMMNTGRQPRQVPRIEAKIKGCAQKSCDYSKANQG